MSFTQCRVPAEQGEFWGADDTPSGEETFSPWLGPSLLAALAAALVWWSWGKWTDAHIDFGNELYLAWQLSEGRHLYLDFAHRNGPFSHYVNALLFSLFGVSLRTLVFANLAILAAIAAMIYRVFRLSCGASTATLVCAFFLCVFAFGQYTAIANFNYVTPYQHFQTHGLALSIAMLLALVEAVRRGQLLWCVAAGMSLGLVFLGKAELFVPALAMAVFGVCVLVASAPAGSAAKRVMAFASGAGLAVGGAYLGLRLAMPAELAALGLRGNWEYMGTGLLADHFYLVGAGLENVAVNFRRVAVMFAWLAVFAGFCAAADRLLPVLRQSPWLCGASGALCCVLGVVLGASLPWLLLARGLPVAALLIAAALWLPRLWSSLATAKKQEGASELSAAARGQLMRWLPIALWAVYALALLAKMPLKARFGHYGFVLAMPASLLLVAALVSLLPRVLRRNYGGGALARALAMGAVAAACIVFLSSTNVFYMRKNFSLATGADAITVEAASHAKRGVTLSRALTVLEKLMKPDDTLLVYPEGVVLNYWLRRVNPTPFTLYLPVELEAFGGDVLMLEEIRQSPPDFVVLVHRPHREFGVGAFGTDPRNGLALMNWIRGGYERIGRVGHEPFTGKGFGLVLLRRVSGDETAGSATPGEE